MKKIIIILLLIINIVLSAEKCVDFNVISDSLIVPQNNLGYISGEIIRFKFDSADFNIFKNTDIDTSFLGVFAVDKNDSITTMGAVLFFNKIEKYQIMAFRSKFIDSQIVLVGLNIPAGTIFTVCYIPEIIKKALYMENK